jgi:DNA repair exonuclease SbcCD ATPase subunit
VSGNPEQGVYHHGETAVPAARYSPLAAQGGYKDGQKSPLDAAVHALNPHNVNLGEAWEQRRRQWLENAGANPYFWFSFFVTVVVILSWFALAWLHNDRVRERWQLAEHAADALRYAEYCKHRAGEAIGRYNDHVEKCNRLIEAGESGLTTPETANLEDHRREITRLAADNDSKDLQVKRLQEELDRKSQELTDIAKRIEQAEQRLNACAKTASSVDAQAKLAERINRLETENRTLTEENRRLRQRSANNKAVAVDEQNPPDES